MSEFSHLDPKGDLQMVDVSDKHVTTRTAIAAGSIRISEVVSQRLHEHAVAKGNVLAAAHAAGVLAAKRTAELIPLCHPVLLDHIELDFEVDTHRIDIRGSVRSHGRTGAEMEALTAVSVAALTIYDMCKALDRTMVIEGICLLEKSGGRSGHFRRNHDS